MFSLLQVYSNQIKVYICSSKSESVSHLVMSDPLWPHGLQHPRLPCPSLSPGVCSNSCPLSRRCHPTISSSVTPSPPSLSLSQHQGLFQWVTSGGQSIGASASVIPMNTQGWFPLGLTGSISLLFKVGSLLLVPPGNHCRPRLCPQQGWIPAGHQSSETSGQPCPQDWSFLQPAARQRPKHPNPDSNFQDRDSGTT